MKRSHQIIVTGIGTDIGKTVVSAILAQALESFYWKPIQAGELDNTDSMKVAAWTNEKVTVLQEAFRLTRAMSPHAAAELEGVHIDETALCLPKVDGNLIIEGAGGLMVPINNEGLLYIELFSKWNLPVIVVSRHYVGSINHTLLTIEALKNRNISIYGIVFVGDENSATENAIKQQTGVKIFARIPIVEKVDAAFILSQAKKISAENLFKNT